MRNYVQTCKGFCGYNLMYNFFVYFLSLTSSLFRVHFSNAFQHGKEALPKHDSKTKNSSSPCHLSFEIAYIGSVNVSISQEYT